MDDQANVPPADENDGRPAIPANADLYPDFMQSVLYELHGLLTPIRGWTSPYLAISDPVVYERAFEGIRTQVEKLRSWLWLAYEAVSVEERLGSMKQPDDPAAVDLGSDVLKLVDSLCALANEETARRTASQTAPKIIYPNTDPVRFSADVPADGPSAWIDPHRAARLFHDLAEIMQWRNVPDQIEITVSWDDEHWLLDLFYKGGNSFERLQRTWEAYRERDSLLVFNYVMEGLALAMVHKAARLHGGDLDLHFASAPRRPGLPPLLDQLTIALRLRRADRM